MDNGPQDAIGRLVDIEKIKESVARDVEAVLNARKTYVRELEDHPILSGTVLNFGLLDFAHVTAYGQEDLMRVCRSIEKAITDHDPRLRRVVVQFRDSNLFVGRWGFDVIADLVVSGASELVSFRAVMDSSKQTFAVSKEKLIP